MTTAKLDVKEWRDGDVLFSLPWADGMGLPQFAGLIQDGPLKRLEDIRNFQTNKNDVILAVFPKSGTNWTWEILNMLVHGKAEYSERIKEFLMVEAVLDLASIEAEASPRVINTHVPFRWLPNAHIENGGKIIHVRRNPKDVQVSMFHHLKSSGEIGPGTKNMSWEQFFNNMVIGEVNVYGGWFDFEKEMEEARKSDKGSCIYTLQYEQLQMDPHKEIKKMADFLSLPYTDQLIRDIVEKCSFNKLKDVQKTVPEGIFGDLEEPKSEDEEKSIPVIYRKGVVGDWKNHFTVAQNEVFDELYKQEMKGCDLDLTYELPQRI